MINGNSIHINNLVVNSAEENSSTEAKLKKLLEDYPDLFDNKYGKYTGPVSKLKLANPNVTPGFIKLTPLPYALREPIEREFKAMEVEGVIERVPNSEWTTSIVPVIKNENWKNFIICFKKTEDAKTPVWNTRCNCFMHVEIREN